MGVLESKRFYLDVKENQRGRFIKVAEISADGRKNQILMTFSTAALFSQNLVKFIDFYEGLNKLDPDNLKQGELKSEVMYKYDNGDADDAVNGPQNKHLRIENKNFYFDIKKNQQGRYMTISEVKGNYRNSILVPESGWEDFRDVLDDYVKQIE